MTTDRGACAALLATLTMLGATPAASQTEQTPQPAPAPVRGLEALGTPQPTQIPVPDAPTIVLPATTPAARAPRTATPAAKSAPKASRTSATGSDERPATRPAQQAAQRSETRATPSSDDTRATPEPRTGATTREPTKAPPSEPVPESAPAAPSGTPSATPAPTTLAPTTPAPTTPAPTTPAATGPQEPTLAAPEAGRAMPLWLSLAVIVVVLAGLWFLRRRKPALRDEKVAREIAAEPVAEPVAPPVPAQPVAPAAPVAPPVAPPAAPPVAQSPAAPRAPAISASPAPKFLEPRGKSPPVAPRARLTSELRPLRAGLNLLSAVVECELVVTNTGTAPAEGIRVGVALLTAHAGQDVDLAAFNAAPVVRPATPPFALAPGESRIVRSVAAIAREGIRPMTAANRPMFVPVVATNILYATAGDAGQIARAWVVGIERVDSAKLAPFWLDAPAKMHGMVAARPHAAEFER